MNVIAPYSKDAVGLRTPFCELMGIHLPIVGAGTGSIASAELAAAVTNAGGLGMTGAAGDPAEAIVARIRAIRELTDGPIGVNVILQILPPETIEAILAEGVDVLATGFGDPEPWVARAHAAGAKVFHRCETAAEAEAAVRAGVDVVIAQGSDSGGHTGIVPTFALVPQIVDAAGGVPVLAAGGIADGRGLVAALALGADGVLLGTCLVASQESGAHADLQAARRRGQRRGLGRHGRLRDRLAGAARARPAQRHDRTPGRPRASRACGRASGRRRSSRTRPTAATATSRYRAGGSTRRTPATSEPWRRWRSTRAPPRASCARCCPPPRSCAASRRRPTRCSPGCAAQESRAPGTAAPAESTDLACRGWMSSRPASARCPRSSSARQPRTATRRSCASARRRARSPRCATRSRASPRASRRAACATATASRSWRRTGSRSSTPGSPAPGSARSSSRSTRRRAARSCSTSSRTPPPAS